ncbi:MULTISPECIES: hypothetical protein [Streptomyces]|uniref:Uncharacterized protein n=1 Tax=Streptomyces siderophoricus TaxID=2802281 RepID=A0ABS1N073_9ACTN|nr:hypothetical protein [Streptomyces sp. 9-7]MBL1093447.1 hypothetical protein [Streptomyces sp. 9-7]
MSDFERAAAEHARLLAERSRKEASERGKAKDTAAHDEQKVRDAARNFFALARRHNAPLFRLYSVIRDQDTGSRYTRTEHECVVACDWGRGEQRTATSCWAVTADNSFFTPVSVSEPWRPRLRDDRVVSTEWSWGGLV